MTWRSQAEYPATQWHKYSQLPYHLFFNGYSEDRREVASVWAYRACTINTICLHPELETTRLLQGLFLFPLIVSVNFVMGICLFGVIDLVTSHCILKHMAQSLAHTIINTAKTSARGAVFISTMGTLQEAVSLLVSTILIGQSVRTSFLAVR